MRTISQQFVSQRILSSTDQNGEIEVKYCQTEDMVADVMTKGLYGERLAKLRKMAGLAEIAESKAEEAGHA